jgi:NitT/TauT family transport system substrate-binding protein
MNRSSLSFTRRGAAMVAVVLAASLALAGCGDAGGTQTAATSGKTTIKVAVQPIGDFSPIWLGIKHGMFADQGLTVEVVPGAASSSEQIPLLSSGQADIAATTAAAALQASSQGIPVSIVGGLTTFGTSVDTDPTGLIVGKDSKVASYADLVGKTVAISGLKSVTQAAIQAAVAKDGGDANGVKFIQIPMPNIANTVASGRADAGFLVDPFLGAATSAGAKVVGHPLYDVAPGYPATSLVASSAYVGKNAGVLKKFSTALAAAVEYSNAHPDEVLAAIAEGAKVPLEKLKGSKIPLFNATVDAALLTKEAEMLHTYGALEKSVDATALVWKG